MIDVAALAADLLRIDSVTPAGPPVFDVVERALAGAGFAVTRLTFAADGTAPVENLFATKGEGRHLAFAGHVDVVPPGPAERWTHPPFAAKVDGDTLYGRGAQDMKGAVAAMIAAGADWAASGAPGRLSFLITGDEEGPAVNGTAPLVAWAAARYPLDAAIVGEPTSRERLGDTIKVGRRGSLSATVTVTGRQGHVAYQHLAKNPVPELLAVAQALLVPLDGGNARFAPSNLEIVSVDVGNPAWNVVPGAASLRFNVRFSDTWTPSLLMNALERRIVTAAPHATVATVFEPASHAFLTRDEALIAAVTAAVAATTGVTPEATTGGGTSDARFIKDFCPVVEFGAVGDTMHQVDERTSVTDLRRLASAYRAVAGAVLG